MREMIGISIAIDYCRAKDLSSDRHCDGHCDGRVSVCASHVLTLRFSVRNDRAILDLSPTQARKA